MEPSISLRCPPGDEGLQPPVRVVRPFEGSGRFLSCHADVLLSRFSPPHHSASGWFPSALGRATVRRGRTVFPGGIVDPNYSGNHRIRVCMDVQSSHTSEQSAKTVLWPYFFVVKIPV